MQPRVDNEASWVQPNKQACINLKEEQKTNLAVGRHANVGLHGYKQASLWLQP